jgi:glutamyl-tRNA synthetase
MAEAEGLKFGDIAQPLRAAVTGSTVSPPIFEVLEILGPEEGLARINDAASPKPAQAISPSSAVQ